MDDNAAVSSAPVPPLPDIIFRYCNGEPIESISKDYGVTRFTIYNWMYSELGDGPYEQVITKALIRGIAEADQALEESADSLSFNKAHARARLRRMDFERRRPKLYGIKQEMSTDSRITVIVQRERPQPVVVEAQCIEGQVVSTQNDESGTD